ncbi:hypothetical protein M3Y94_01111100 [Aphelenchoides besseyi]|nr:hypothetical protein M3Y94_01111100 [Aphelenchoides besseyi]KAI6221516.1 hypothetical protein M3Y95_00970100 [Aphelenchoides besseyi]
MRSLIVLVCLVNALIVSTAVVGTKPKVQVAQNVTDQKLSASVAQNAFSYGIDAVASVSQTTFQCLSRQGYSLAFLRIYSPANGGQVDSTGVNNIYAASAAKLLYEVFVTPSPTSSKSGSTQFTEAYNYATSQGLSLNRMWLQVTSPINWYQTQSYNTQFIQSFINTANSYGIQVGVYTSWYDWQQITGSTVAVSPPYLWYWNANGLGASAESVRDASDFYSFGPFRSPNVKQFGLSETICSTYVNVNLFNNNGFNGFNTVKAEAMAKYLKEH